MLIKSVRLYERDNETGELLDRKEEYDLDQFAGSLPAPGDFIVSPWAATKDYDDRREPEYRTVYEIESRYFLPNISKFKDGRIVYVALVVKPRRGTVEEMDFFSVI